MKKVLFITPFFYPQNAIGVLRIGGWVKYLSLAGYSISVITTKKYFFNEPLNLEANFDISKVKIYEIDYLPNFIVRKKLSSNNHNIQNKNVSYTISLRYFYNKAKAFFGNFSDIYNFWIIPAYKFTLELLKKEKFDIIISSYNPPASHIVAYKIKKNYPDLFWIADYRDLWSLNHINIGKLNFLEKMIEKHIIKNADLITTVSEPLKNQLLYEFDLDNVEVIYNGYDKDDFPNLSSLEKSKPIFKGKFDIIYTGTIYEGKQNPIPLIWAFNELIEERFLKKNQVNIYFYGKCKIELENILRNCKCDKYNIVKYGGIVSREKSIQIQKNADMLLFLEWNDLKAKGVLTGKIFEYMVSGKPVIAIGVNNENEAARLIKRTGIGILATNKQEAKTIIRNIIKKGFYFYEPNLNEIKKYEISQNVNKLINLISYYENKRK